MKKIKRIATLIICAVMLLTALPLTSSAEEGMMPFTDVKEGAWYYEGIEFCYLYGIVSGMTETTFAPNATLTRAQFVQMLAMYDGADLEAYKGNDSGFDDVKTNHWFNAPVCWAVEQGYVSGMSPTKFGPNEKITREQLARLVYLYAESIGCEVERYADLSGFEDESKVSDWAYTQVQWAVAAGIISGTSETKLSPRATATRAQACRIMMTLSEFVTYGFRDMSGAYAVIVEYIKANGEYYSDDTVSAYICDEEYDGYAVSMEYVENDESVSIAYLTGYYEYEEDDATWNGYAESALLYAYTLGCDYDFIYNYGQPDTESYMYSGGYMGLEYYNEIITEIEGYGEAELNERVANAQAYIRERIALILAEADMSLEDFFLPAENETDELYDALVQYVVENGEEAPFGSIVLYTEEGDKAYVTEYVPETGELCLIYVSEPIPGGTDIYDTEYREHAILLFSSTVNDGYVLYTYENEDEGKNIMAEGGFDGNEAALGDINAVGFGEEEAQAMADAAVPEVIGYFNDVLNAALNGGESDPAYDALVQHVVENGEEAPFGSIVLYTEEGDKAYVTEYVPETGELCLIYVSEPIPGGTDIYDTEYREHAILLIDAFLGDEYFLYTYYGEDETTAIVASGTTDTNTLNIDDIVCEGIGEEESTAKLESAMAEVIDYYCELLSSAIA